MFAHHIAYRHDNGDIEEFLGSGLSQASARQNSVYAAKAAVSLRHEAFSVARIVDGPTMGRAADRARINAKIEAHQYLSALL
jgi:hypothetical protein